VKLEFSKEGEDKDWMVKHSSEGGGDGVAVSDARFLHHTLQTFLVATVSAIMFVVE
jgi:hypothetical protein